MIGIALQTEPKYSRKKTLACALLAVALLLLVLPAQLNPSDFLQDDAYFYMQVASNILRGNGSTFNGITPTNGYHPLWMLFSILGLFIAGNNKVQGLHVVFGLQVLLFMGMAYYFRRIASLISDVYWLVGVAILAIYSFSVGIYASEAHLNALMLVMSIYYFLLALGESTASNWAKAGIFSGLAVLARLDNVFVIGALFSLVLASHQKWSADKTLKRSLLVGFSFACIVAPYLLYNYYLFDHFVPISGAIKTTFPVVTGNIKNLGRFGQGTAAFAILSVVFSFDQGLNREQRAILRTLGAGVLIHAGYVVLYTDHYTFWPWYYVPGVVNAAFLADAALQRIGLSLRGFAGHRSVTWLRDLAVITLILLGIGRGWLKAYNPQAIGPVPIPQINEYRWPDELAVWMRDSLPPGSVLFAYDWPGALAYYSDLQILPMDGLMNDYRYNDDLVWQGIDHYLCANNVGFFFGPDEPSKNGLREFEVLAPLYQQPVGTIKLLDQNLVVRVKDVVGYPQETPSLAIWRIDPCGALE